VAGKYHAPILKGLNTLSGEGAGMGGGSSATGCRTKIGQGKGVARGPEDFWDITGGGEKNHP